jgi:hypothetical protein
VYGALLDRDEAVCKSTVDRIVELGRRSAGSCSPSTGVGAVGWT